MTPPPNAQSTRARALQNISQGLDPDAARELMEAAAELVHLQQRLDERVPAPTCGTCRHWTPINRGGDGSCSRIGVAPDTFKHEGYILISYPPDMAHEFPAGLTRHTFGCVRHEARP